jgi:RNA polymerase sigma factor (sigma-70 family)
MPIEGKDMAHSESLEFDFESANSRLIRMLKFTGCGHEDAEDITQETFLYQLMVERRQIIRSPRAWRRKVAKRMGITLLRKMARHARHFNRLVARGQERGAQDTPFEVERDEEISAIQEAVRRLPYDLERIVKAYMVEDSFAAVGRLFHMPASTVRARWLEALEILYRELLRFGEG